MPFFCCRTQWPDTSRLAGFESEVGRGKPNSPPRNLLSRFVPRVLTLSLTDLLLHELFVRVTHSKRWPYECCRKTDGEQSESSTHFSSIHHNQPRCNCNSSSPNAERGQRRREEKKESDATPCKTKLQCEYIWMGFIWMNFMFSSLVTLQTSVMTNTQPALAPAPRVF